MIRTIIEPFVESIISTIYSIHPEKICLSINAYWSSQIGRCSLTSKAIIGHLGFWSKLLKRALLFILHIFYFLSCDQVQSLGGPAAAWAVSQAADVGASQEDSRHQQESPGGGLLCLRHTRGALTSKLTIPNPRFLFYKKVHCSMLIEKQSQINYKTYYTHNLIDNLC